jgi:hypothetical protein
VEEVGISYLHTLEHSAFANPHFLPRHPILTRHFS